MREELLNRELQRSDDILTTSRDAEFHMMAEKKRVLCREVIARAKVFHFWNKVLLTSCFLWNSCLALALSGLLFSVCMSHPLL